MDDVIKLIPITKAKDARGVDKKVEGTPREVFCKTSGITRREFFDGGRNGLNPERVFYVFAEDYEGETIIEHEGKRYSVYRTFKSDNNTYVSPNMQSRQELMQDYIELYVERKGGTDGKKDSN